MALFLILNFNNYLIMNEEIFLTISYLNEKLIFNKWLLLLNFFSEEKIIFPSHPYNTCIDFKCKSLFSIFELKKFHNSLLLCCDLNFNLYYINNITT